MKVSIIMSSYLGEYPGAAKERDKKFIRAVKSFQNQSYTDKELIIVSDGCEKTIALYEQYFKNDTQIRLIKLPKQQMYSGEMRNVALRDAQGDVISYLDSDDVLGKQHLEIIMNQFDTKKYNWVFYNDYLVTEPTFKKLHLRVVETRFGSIGTSAITHLKDERLKWSSGYGHDWVFVLKLAGLGTKFTKLKQNPQYLVCHYYNGDF